jgi:hypothetical protein
LEKKKVPQLIHAGTSSYFPTLWNFILAIAVMFLYYKVFGLPGVFAQAPMVHIVRAQEYPTILTAQEDFGVMETLMVIVLVLNLVVFIFFLVGLYIIFTRAKQQARYPVSSAPTHKREEDPAINLPRRQISGPIPLAAQMEALSRPNNSTASLQRQFTTAELQHASPPAQTEVETPKKFKVAKKLTLTTTNDLNQSKTTT